MKPFNLQRALAGDKVVTRDGREVTQLTKFDGKKIKYCLFGVIDELVSCWNENGQVNIGYKDKLDLFMAPKTVKRWVNFYNHYARAYETEEKAKSYGTHTIGAIAIAVPVEFEEGYGCE